MGVHVRMCVTVKCVCETGDNRFVAEAMPSNE